MTSDSLWRAVGWVTAAGLAAVWAYSEWIVQPERRQQRSAEQKAVSSQRFNEWARVAKEREIAPGETIRLVVVPHPSGDMLDTKCFIYTHREFRTSSMICPDATREFIAEHE